MFDMLPVILAIACWGLAPLLARMGLQVTDPLAGLSIRTSVIALGVWLVVLFTDRWQAVTQIPLRSTLLLAGDGLLAGFAAQLAFYWSLKLNEASRVTPAVATYPLVTLLLSAAFFGEKLTVPKLVGALLIVAGLVLIRR